MRICAIGAVCSVGMSTALTSTFCGFLLLSWFLSGSMFSGIRYSCTLLPGIALISFFVIIVMGCFYGSATFEEKLDSLWSWRKLGYTLLLIPIFADSAWKNRFFKSFFVVSILGLLASFFSWLGWVDFQIDDTPGVVLQNWTTQAMIFTVATLLSYHFAIKSNTRFKLFIFLAAIAFILNILFITPSRSGYIGLLVVLLTIGVSFFGLRRLPLILIGLCVVSWGAYFSSESMKEKVELGWIQADELLKQEATTLNSNSFRLIAYQNSLEIIGQRPVFGFGTGGFPVVYADHVRTKYPDWRAQPTSDPHNQYMLILVENGVIGLSFFIFFIISYFFSEQKKDEYFVIGVGILITWCLTSLFNSHFRTFPEGHLIGLFLGVILASDKSNTLLYFFRKKK